MDIFKKYSDVLKDANLFKYSGKISKLVGLTIESQGPTVEIGEVCHIYPLKDEKPIKAEVVGFRNEIVLLMPLGEMGGIGPGSRVVATGRSLEVDVGQHLLGRVLDGLGSPIDDKGLITSKQKYTVNNAPPNPLLRNKINDVIPLGIKAIDGLVTCGKGQRMGIFSGSGVGKSTLMGMIAKNTKADVNVIALIGERGREVREFIENDLQDEGLRRSVLVIATSDKPALVRTKAAYIATAIAEYFRDLGKNVMLMMDSLTRFSLAQREVGLAVGEPPVTRGYTPSVFAVLPKLLERAGNSEKGSITALYTVLVDGDDLNEPITDTARGILDGHIFLSRKLASQGHYPAIDVLNSISRVMPNIVSDSHMNSSRIFREYLSVYKEAEDLINIGAYSRGSNKKIDMAIEKIDSFNTLLRQGMNEKVSFEETLSILEKVTL